MAPNSKVGIKEINLCRGFILCPVLTHNSPPTFLSQVFLTDFLCTPNDHLVCRYLSSIYSFIHSVSDFVIVQIAPRMIIWSVGT